MKSRIWLNTYIGKVGKQSEGIFTTLDAYYVLVT